MMPGSTAQRGLSLLEIIIAVAILGSMGVLGFATLKQSLDTQIKVTQRTERMAQIRSGLLRMAREISMAYLSQHRDCFDPRSRTIFLGNRERFGMRLDMTTLSHQRMLADGKESDQNEIAYYVDTDPNSNHITHLYRREAPRIDERPQIGGSTEVMVENVESLHFSFYDDKTDRWVDFWDNTRPESYNRLPPFVEISLEVTTQTKNPVKKTYSTKTRIVNQPQALLISGVMFTPCAQ